jgi:hypothetical protein
MHYGQDVSRDIGAIEVVAEANMRLMDYMNTPLLKEAHALFDSLEGGARGLIMEALREELQKKGLLDEIDNQKG